MAVGADIYGNTIYTDFSNEVSVKVDTTSITEPEPDPVTLPAPDLSVSSVVGSTITLNWTHDCPEAVTICTYSIEGGNAKVRGVINFIEIAVGNGFTYSTEESSGTYYYKVHATAGSDISADSNIVSVKLK